MDAPRFDTFTRKLGSGASRREVIKTLAGSALGVVGIAGLAGGAAEAAECVKCGGTPCNPGKPGQCPEGCRCVQEQGKPGANGRCRKSRATIRACRQARRG